MGRDSWKKLGSVILPFLVYYVVHDLASILLAFLLGLSLGNFGEGYQEFLAVHAGSVDGVLNGLALCIGALAVWPMADRELRLKEGRKALLRHKAALAAGNSRATAGEGICGGLEHRGGQAAGISGNCRKLLEYPAMMFCAVCLAVGMNLLLTLTGVTGLSENYTEISARQYGVGLALGLVLYGLVSPLAEETVFRGLIYNRMKQHLKTGHAILLCGVLFGVYHGNLVQGIYGCVLGVMITVVYEWYESIWAPVLFHGAANAAVFLICYDAERLQRILTPFYCVLFLALSVCSVLLIGKWKTGKENPG